MKRAEGVVVAIVLGLMLSVCLASPGMAEEESPSAEVSVSALSAYIWRGQELSRDSIVIQPSMTVGYKGFAANFWGNMDTNPYVAAGDPDRSAKWTETDLTLSYERSFGPVTATGGYVYYGVDAADDSQEVFVSLGVDTLLSPSLTIYKEIDSNLYWYFLVGISHSFQITEAVSLDLSASASYLESEDAEVYPQYDDQGTATGSKFSNFHDGVISASLPISVAKHVTVTPNIAYTFPLSSDAENEMKARSLRGTDDSFLYGGVVLCLAF